MRACVAKLSTGIRSALCCWWCEVSETKPYGQPFYGSSHMPVLEISEKNFRSWKREVWPGTESNCRHEDFSSRSGAGLCDTIGHYMYLFKRLAAFPHADFTDSNNNDI